MEICPYFGRRKGKRREPPLEKPSGHNCCYAELPEEEPALATVTWLRKVGFLAQPDSIECLPVGRAHQAEYCLTAKHVECRLYKGTDLT